MSRTSDLCCTQCNIGLWIGQSSFIYRGDDETMLALDIFLQVHRGHPLIFDFMEVTQNSRHAENLIGILP